MQPCKQATHSLEQTPIQLSSKKSPGFSDLKSYKLTNHDPLTIPRRLQSQCVQTSVLLSPFTVTLSLWPILHFEAFWSWKYTWTCFDLSSNTFLWKMVAILQVKSSNSWLSTSKDPRSHLYLILLPIAVFCLVSTLSILFQGLSCKSKWDQG